MAHGFLLILVILYRANTNNSAANSPSIASSPVVGTFTTTKDIQRRSPAPSLMQRVPSSRGRQNSGQSLLQENRNKPSSSAAVKATNGNGSHNTPYEVEKVSGLPSKNPNDTKSSSKEVVSAKGDALLEENSSGQGVLRGGTAAGSRGTDKSMKREDTDSKARIDRPRSISISTRGGGKLSKTSTPTQGSFSESQRSRPMRNTEPPKRSHKKGAGLAAQLAAQLAHEDDASSLHSEEDDDDDDDTEPRYCYCNQVSYGEMVACDMDTCPREWFHLDCVGLSRAPTKNGKFMFLRKFLLCGIECLINWQRNGIATNARKPSEKAKLVTATVDET